MPHGTSWTWHFATVFQLTAWRCMPYPIPSGMACVSCDISTTHIYVHIFVYAPPFRAVLVDKANDAALLSSGLLPVVNVVCGLYGLLYVIW